MDDKKPKIKRIKTKIWKKVKNLKLLEKFFNFQT